MIHLDTNFLICATRPNSPEGEKIKEWLCAGETFSMSTVAWAEYLCGESLSDQSLQTAQHIVTRQIDFTKEMAILSARLFNETGRHRRMFADCMIAATAIVEQTRIATVNLKDFQQFERFGLALMPPVSH